MQTGLVQVELFQKFYGSIQCAASHGIAHIEHLQKINRKIASFRDKPITLMRGQRAATASPQPSAIAESSITNAQIFGFEDIEKQLYKNVVSMRVIPH